VCFGAIVMRWGCTDREPISVEEGVWDVEEEAGPRREDDLVAMMVVET
jgi:hypothetical protein